MTTTVTHTDTLSSFAETIMRNKYLHPGEESWADIAHRVATEVVGPYLPDLVKPIERAIASRKFIPGGRFLAQAGSEFTQTSNCFLMRAGDSREEWADLMRKAVSALMTGGGVGVVYSDLRGNGTAVKGMGGTSTGPLALMDMVNEAGRHIMAGGNRRAALWAGLHWWHPDVFDFIAMKDWDDETKARKEKDFSAPARMDGTNISIILDDDFFTALEDETYEHVFEVGDGGDTFVVTHEHAKEVYRQTVEHMLTTAEPGFSVDTGENFRENLRNPCPVAGHTHVLTDEGYKPITDIAGIPTTVFTGEQWAPDVVFQMTNPAADTLRVEMTGGRVIEAEPSHPFIVRRYKGLGKARRYLDFRGGVEAKDLQVGDEIEVSLPVGTEQQLFDTEAYTLGWMYGDGTFNKNGFAELTLCSDESQACFPFLTGYRTVTQPDARGYARLYFDKRFAGRVKRYVPQEDITPSFIAGLWDADGNYDVRTKSARLASKEHGFLVEIRRGLERMGILSHISKNGTSKKSVNHQYQLRIAAESLLAFKHLIPVERVDLSSLSSDYKPYRASSVKVLSVTPAGVQPVYCANVNVPEHTFMAEGVIISNCEITSEDSDDICCLGSINLARVESIEEMEQMVYLGTALLLCGTLYGRVPYAEVEATRTKNRRLGLGLMGVAEWLIARDLPYAPSDELAEWLEVYTLSGTFAGILAEELGVSRPVKTRAIAPTGTLAIIAETTSALEPLFAAAYKRRYLTKDGWRYQYVVDATAQRLTEKYGADLDEIDTAYNLAKTPERRIEFQAWLQGYVDHAISSTLNLPSVAEHAFTAEEFGTMLLKYLPRLRGITAYPDGARGGQPLNVVPYAEAWHQQGVEYSEDGLEQACVTGICGV